MSKKRGKYKKKLYILVKSYDTGLDTIKDLYSLDNTSFDKMSWEKILHELPKEQLEVFVFLYLGFKPAEIVKLLNISSLSKFYKINKDMKNTYKSKKISIF